MRTCLSLELWVPRFLDLKENFKEIISGVYCVANRFFHSEAVMCTNCWPVWLNTTELFFRCFDIITTVNTVKEVGSSRASSLPRVKRIALWLGGTPTPHFFFCMCCQVCTHPDMTNTSTSDPNYIAADDVRCLTK